eukprot:470973-Rhodomonas_salina.1
MSVPDVTCAMLVHKKTHRQIVHWISTGHGVGRYAMLGPGIASDARRQIRCVSTGHHIADT